MAAARATSATNAIAANRKRQSLPAPPQPRKTRANQVLRRQTSFLGRGSEDEEMYEDTQLLFEKLAAKQNAKRKAKERSIEGKLKATMDAQVNALDLACRKGEEDFRLLAEGRTTELTELQDNYSNEQIIFVEEIAKIKALGQQSLSQSEEMARSLRRFIAVAQTEISNFDNEIARQAEMAKRAIEQVAEYTSGQVQREAESYQRKNKVVKFLEKAVASTVD